MKSRKKTKGLAGTCRDAELYRVPLTLKMPFQKNTQTKSLKFPLKIHGAFHDLPSDPRSSPIHYKIH